MGGREVWEAVLVLLEWLSSKQELDRTPAIYTPSVSRLWGTVPHPQLSSASAAGGSRVGQSSKFEDSELLRRLLPLCSDQTRVGTRLRYKSTVRHTLSPVMVQRARLNRMVNRFQ